MRTYNYSKGDSYMVYKIDEKDKAILEAIQEDGRIAFSQIAKRIGTSEATVFARVKKLLKRGYIKKFTALISPEHLGKSLTAFILINAEPKRHKSVLESLKSMDDVIDFLSSDFSRARIEYFSSDIFFIRD